MTECLFCKIAAGEIPSKKVYEDSQGFAFLDINPRNPGHSIVVPKKHAENIFSMEESDATELMKAVRKIAIGVQKATGAGGISITQSNGPLAGQRVPHVHFHVIPRTEAEKGYGLEEVMQVKKQDDASLDKMAKKVSGSIPKERVKKEEKPEPEPEPETKEIPTEDAEPSAGEPRTRDPDEAHISFDF